MWKSIEVVLLSSWCECVRVTGEYRRATGIVTLDDCNCCMFFYLRNVSFVTLVSISLRKFR